MFHHIANNKVFSSGIIQSKNIGASSAYTIVITDGIAITVLYNNFLFYIVYIIIF